jgi:hypothetical protein
MSNGISFPSPTLNKVTLYFDVLPFNSVLPMICLSMSLPTQISVVLLSRMALLQVLIMDGGFLNLKIT